MHSTSSAERLVKASKSMVGLKGSLMMQKELDQTNNSWKMLDVLLLLEEGHGNSLFQTVNFTNFTRHNKGLRL